MPRMVCKTFFIWPVIAVVSGEVSWVHMFVKKLMRNAEAAERVSASTNEGECKSCLE